MKLELEISIEDFRDMVRVAVVAVTAAAIYHELQKPPHLREWHGEVGGVVPYDFRAPTLERMRDAYWNPDDHSTFTKTAFGVGWAVNLAAVARSVGRIGRDALTEARARLEARG